MKTRIPLLAALLALLAASPALARKPAPWTVTDEERPRVEIAILLDTSSSMDGLINQAKTKLWGIVNKVAQSRKNGRAPDLRVALYEYGKQSLPAKSGWIRQVVPLTSDLDAVSEALFALSTNGGDEYCGQAISRAVEELEWTEGDHYRAIFIAGNEPFSQGPVSWRRAVSQAQQAGISVNPIHCGAPHAAKTGQWELAAAVAGGSFMNIDQNAKVATVVTPYDGRIATLGGKLNDTYLAYGRAGSKKKARQSRLDRAAAEAAPAAAADRALAKASAQYTATEWDLVDAEDAGAVDLDEMAEAEMPEELRGKSASERREVLADKKAERTRIQSELKDLQKKRDAYLATARKKEAKKATFDLAVEEALTEQMTGAGFDFE